MFVCCVPLLLRPVLSQQLPSVYEQQHTQAALLRDRTFGQTRTLLSMCQGWHTQRGRPPVLERCSTAPLHRTLPPIIQQHTDYTTPFHIVLTMFSASCMQATVPFLAAAGQHLHAMAREGQTVIERIFYMRRFPGRMNEQSHRQRQCS